jgi:large subunit ribosomal protein L33
MAKKGESIRVVRYLSPSEPLVAPIPPRSPSAATPGDRTGMLTTLFPTAKSRTIAVRLISMAMTGYYRTMMRPRVHRPLSMLKYDPVVKKKVLFLEATKGGRAK